MSDKAQSPQGCTWAPVADEVPHLAPKKKRMARGEAKDVGRSTVFLLGQILVTLGPLGLESLESCKKKPQVKTKSGIRQPVKVTHLKTGIQPGFKRREYGFSLIKCGLM